jgi:hypothetical protein
MNTVDAAAKALEIRHGILHTEVKMTPQGPRIIEVNGRLGGGVSAMIARIGGPSLLSSAIRLALRHDVGPLHAPPWAPVAFFRWIVAPIQATRFVDVAGVPDVKALPGVSSVTINCGSGDLIDFQGGSTVSHIMRIDGTVDSHEELHSLVHEITRLLDFTWGYGESSPSEIAEVSL